MVSQGPPTSWLGRRVVFLSGTAGDTRRYRCEYQAEQLRMLGASVVVAGLEDGDPPESLLEPTTDLVVFHRAGWTPAVGTLVAALRAEGVATVYDSDDLVFEPEAATLVPWPPDASVDERRELFAAQRRLLEECGRGTFSTEPLARAASVVARVAVTPNVAGIEMLREADAALASPCPGDERFVIAYFSGTATHQQDFRQVADAVLEVLERHPESAFLGVGYLELDPRFAHHGERVELLPFQPREQLPRLLRSVAVNLAPLEPENRFAQAKSAVKFLEAALVGVPTIASASADFARVIEDGRSGFLAAGRADWGAALERLHADAQLRRAVGARAAAVARAAMTTASHAPVLGAVLAELVGTLAPVGDPPPIAVSPSEAALRLRVAALERDVADARRDADAANRHIAAIQETVSWRVTRPLRTLRGLSRRRVATAVEARLPAEPELAAVLFVSGAPEVSQRYRCEHQAEQLRLRGATASIVRHGEADLLEALDRHELVVLHRVAWGPDVAALLDRARSAGKRFVFDTDDLVFEPDALGDVGALEDLPAEEVRLYEEGLHRYRRTLESCDAATTSTEPLAERARTLCPEVCVTPNVAAAAMVEASERALRRRKERDEVVVGYMSGTNTHKRDFRIAAPAVLDALRRERAVRLRVVGPLILDDEFGNLDGRVERLPLQPWERFADVQAGVDLNLAPLEPENRFTESKSAVKWLEAGLVEVPTVASPSPDFRRVIRDGENGVLAGDEEEWRRAVGSLVRDAPLRRRLGAAARADILRRHTTRAWAPEYERQLHRLAPRHDGPLTVNWLMYSPIRQNSGGYRNLFRIANGLGSRGHRQRLLVHPVQHLAGMSPARIRDFVAESFGIPDHGELVVGHHDVPRADVSIATYWPTAYTVARHPRSLFKAYFVQDFEPEFYAEDDPEYARALATYHLPLRHICLGRHMQARIAELTGLPAEHVDFALDPVFRLERPPGRRNDPPRILYFARPELRRRGYAVGIEALRLLKELCPQAEIVFFGSRDGELGEVPFAFRNLGVLDADGVARAMNDADILLTFSLTNISNVPFEGMACGCAVVDLDLPNVSTMVEPETCLLVPFEPGALADAMRRLVADPDLRARLGARGAEAVRTRTWERTAAMFEEALRGVAFVGAAAPGPS